MYKNNLKIVLCIEKYKTFNENFKYLLILLRNIFFFLLLILFYFEKYLEFLICPPKSTN